MDHIAEGPRGEAAAVARWRKSSYSGGNGCCVEVALDMTEIRVRDSKFRRVPGNDPGSEPILSFTPDEWSAFIAGVKAGEFG